MIGSGVVHKLKGEVNIEATKHMVREKLIRSKCDAQRRKFQRDGGNLVNM